MRSNKEEGYDEVLEELDDKEGDLDIKDIRANSLTYKKVTTDMLKQVIPYSATGLLINGGSFVNVLILSQIGEKVLASTALISVTQLLTVATAKASLSSTSVVTARNLVQTNALAVVLQQSWLQSLIETIPFALGLGFSEQFFNLAGQDPELAAIAGGYLRRYIVALPAILGLKSNEMFAIGTGHTKLVLIFNGLHTVSTLGLTYVLAMGKLGFPVLGINGGAYATAISSWTYFTAMTIYFRFHKDFRPFNLFARQLSERGKTLKMLFAVGLPVGLQVGIEFVFIYAKTLMAGNLSENALSAEQIVTQWMSLFLGINGAVSAISGIMSSSDITKYRGANLRKIGFSGLMLTEGVSLLALILFSTADRFLSMPFTDDSADNYEEIIHLVKWLFVVNGVNGLVDALSKASTGSLRGFYDTPIPTVFTLLGLWLAGIPTSYVLGFSAGLGVLGLAIGRGLGLLTASIPQFTRWWKKSGDPEQAVRNHQAGELSQWSRFFRQTRQAARTTCGFSPLVSAEQESESLESGRRRQRRCVIS